MINLFIKNTYIVLTKEEEFILDNDIRISLYGLYKVAQEVDEGYVVAVTETRTVTVNRSDCRLATNKEIVADKLGYVCVVIGILVFLGVVGLLTLYSIDISSDSINLSGMLTSPLHYVLFAIVVVILGILAMGGGFI